jgi:hypothetical protein
VSFRQASHQSQDFSEAGKRVPATLQMAHTNRMQRLPWKQARPSDAAQRLAHSFPNATLAIAAASIGTYFRSVSISRTNAFNASISDAETFLVSAK